VTRNRRHLATLTPESVCQAEVAVPGRQTVNKTRMPESCCVTGCSTRRDYKKSRELGLSMFRMPSNERNERRRAAWITAISRKDRIPPKWAMVCGLHFVSGRLATIRSSVIKVPSYWLGTTSYVPKAYVMLRTAATGRPVDNELDVDYRPALRMRGLQRVSINLKETPGGRCTQNQTIDSQMRDIAVVSMNHMTCMPSYAILN